MTSRKSLISITLTWMKCWDANVLFPVLYLDLVFDGVDDETAR
jgi:hypothetical protein